MINLKLMTLKLNKTLTTSFLISFLTGTAILSGVVPTLSLETGRLNFTQKVLAQDNQKIQSFAQAIAEIENLRKPAFKRIEAIVGDQKTAQLSCDQKNTINQLQENAKKIAEDYCNDSKKIVKKYGLTISEFNQFRTKIQQDASFKQQVQNLMPKK